MAELRLDEALTRNADTPAVIRLTLTSRSWTKFRRLRKGVLDAAADSYECGTVHLKHMSLTSISRREHAAKTYLADHLPGVVNLCDVILVAEGYHFPAHSVYVALSSQFFQDLIINTGPFTHKQPQLLDTICVGHTKAVVQLFLDEVYGRSPLMASDRNYWLILELHTLADKLDCPDMLETCVRFLTYSEAQFSAISAQEALRWLKDTLHKPDLARLHKQCVARLAVNFQEVQAQVQELPSDMSTKIMAIMAAYWAGRQAATARRQALRKALGKRKHREQD